MEKTILLNGMNEVTNVFVNLANTKYNGFASLQIVKSKDLLKRGNPLSGCNVVEEYGIQVMLNSCDYYNKQANKGNIIEEHQKQSGRSPLVKGFIDVSDRDGTGYIRAYLVPNMKKTNVTYYVDGVKATAEQIEVIKQFSKKTAPRNPKNSAELVGYKFDNIAAFKVNGVIYVLNHNNIEYKVKDLALQA